MINIKRRKGISLAFPFFMRNAVLLSLKYCDFSIKIFNLKIFPTSFAFPPDIGIEMQLLLKPCFSFHLICSPTSQFNLAAVFSFLHFHSWPLFFTTSFLLLLLSGFSMQSL